jgi:hypothetical protein
MGAWPGEPHPSVKAAANTAKKPTINDKNADTINSRELPA